jgi:hypothetical protein
MPGHLFVDEEKLTADKLNDKEIRVVNGALVSTNGQNGKIFGWQNTVVSGTILVHKILIYITTPATAAANINVGHNAADATSDDLIDGADLDGTAGDVKNSVKDAGTNGLGAVQVLDDEWITGYEDNTADPADLVGEYYIFYTTI